MQKLAAIKGDDGVAFTGSFAGEIGPKPLMVERTGSAQIDSETSGGILPTEASR